MISSDFIKFSFIRKMPNGKYKVVSRKGKNLGVYNTKEEANKRLQQIEYFKKKASVSIEDADDYTYSAILRLFRKELDQEEINKFLSIYHKNFYDLYLNKEEDLEKKCLDKSLKEFNILEKKAELSELGSGEEVGKYLANIIKFTLNRISPLNRQKSINRLKQKIYLLNEGKLSSKQMPASASMGNAITFIKHILFSQDPAYIRSVINNIVKNL